MPSLHFRLPTGDYNVFLGTRYPSLIATFLLSLVVDKQSIAFKTKIRAPLNFTIYVLHGHAFNASL